MDILRYSSNAWGQTVLEGASWDLLPIFFITGVVVIVLHLGAHFVTKRFNNRPLSKRTD